MAKQANLQGAIDKLRTSNEKVLGEVNDRSGEIAFNTRTTKNLIGDMLDGMALDRQRGQDEEETVAPAGGGRDNGSPESKDSGGGFGIARMLAGLAGAALGFVRGFISAFTRPLMKALKSFKKAFSSSNLGKTVTQFGKNLSKQFKLFFKPLVNTLKNIRIAFSEGLKGNAKIVRGAMGRMMNPVKGFVGIFGRIGNLLSPIVKDMKRRIKVVRKSFGLLRTGVSSVSGFFGRIGSVFSRVGQGIKAAGSALGSLGNVFKGFFKVFATIGRVVAFPITIITGLVGGFMNMFKEGKESMAKGDSFFKVFVNGFYGFIEGAINAVIMAPLDMLKDGIGWIAGKLGFENFENMLAGFSFSGLFSGLIDGIKTMIFGIADFFVQLVTDPIGLFKKIGAAIGGFMGSIGESISGMFRNLIDGVFGFFTGDEGMFAKLGEGVANIKNKFREFILGMLPERGSFAAKFVPDSVYEWAGATPPPAEAGAEPVAVADAQEATPKVEMSKEELQQQLVADKKELAYAIEARDDGTGSDMDVEAAEMFVKMTEMQLAGIKELTTSNKDMNEARLEAIKTNDTSKLEEVKKKERRPRKSYEELQMDRLAKMKDQLERGEATFTWSQAELDGADAASREWMLKDNSEEGQANQLKELSKSIAAKEKELEDYKLKQAQKEVDIAKYGSAEGARLAKMSEADREKNLTRAREMIAKSERGEEVLSANKRRAEALLAADANRQSSMIVAPSTNVVNNSAPTTAVMNMNMPATDALDLSYGA
jgi:hypothetical protein